MKSFYIVPNMSKPDSVSLVWRMIRWFINRDLQVMVALTPDTQAIFGDYCVTDDLAIKQCDIIIVLGGDGTLLATARCFASHQKPLLGINIGNLGFLSEVEASRTESCLDQLILGHYTLEKRMMLCTSLDGVKNGRALNDVVISRASISRMLRYTLYINDQLVDRYSADGVIIATPTGSTAYNLSASGPILAPHSEMMVITPICPHGFGARSIVLSGSDQVKIAFDENRNQWNKDLTLTIDGQETHVIHPETQVCIGRDAFDTLLVKIDGNDFYSLLRQKLKKQS